MTKFFQKINNKLSEIINNIISKINIFIGVVSLIFIGILLFLGLGNYVLTELMNNKLDFLFKLIGINLTLFGFCLIGGVLEKKVPELKKIEINLFNTSLFFLTSTILMFLSIALTYLPKTKPFYVTLSSSSILPLLGGLIFFIIGLLSIYVQIKKHSDNLPDE